MLWEVVAYQKIVRGNDLETADRNYQALHWLEQIDFGKVFQRCQIVGKSCRSWAFASDYQFVEDNLHVEHHLVCEKSQSASPGKKSPNDWSVFQ